MGRRVKTCSFTVPTPWKWSSWYTLSHDGCHWTLSLFNQGIFEHRGVFPPFVKLVDGPWRVGLLSSCFLTSARNLISGSQGHRDFWTLLCFGPISLWSPLQTHLHHQGIVHLSVCWHKAFWKQHNFFIASRARKSNHRLTIDLGFFMGRWESLRSESTFSFPAILEMNKTATGSCYHWSQ